ADVAAAFEGVDSVIHCAAIPGARRPYNELLDINVVGTVNMLEEAGSRPEVEQFIFISSIMAMGVLEEQGDTFMPRFLPFDESHPCLSQSYYGGGKAQAEHWCRVYAQRFHKPAVVFRPPYILSLAQESHFEPQPAPGYPALLDYIAASDLVAAIAAALDYHPQDGYDCFLVHAYDQRSTTRTLELVDQHFPDVPADREKLMACDGFASFVDCAHAREALGWEPRFWVRK
ncbi:MAG TPA: NAD(P)-dependent oxidoreductase, partial [Candidatus Hydrogenedentes bacterium]|nr:NAD(P)-dependent oxidoreductase [Candidatus Hydrogenedentota bacterium]